MLQCENLVLNLIINGLPSIHHKLFVFLLSFLQQF